MFQTNSRVERDNGIRFYEQDVLSSDYVYTGDMVIDLSVDYLYPGIGILLAVDNGKPLNEVDSLYLFKLGDNDFHVIERHYLSQSTPVEASCAFAASDANTNANLIFSKKGQVVELNLVTHNPVTNARELRELGHYTIKGSLDKYRIGFYSNAGNTLKYASIASGIPTNWMVNIKNTNGGRIAFFRDGFIIEGCEHAAELEQQEIELCAGTYYVEYQSEKVNEANDIECFIFNSTDIHFDDAQKSILENGRFILAADGKVNIKFKGTSGKITNVSMKDLADGAYVETEGEVVTQDGSYITVNLIRLKSISWKGTISDLPEWEDLTKECPYGIVATKHERVTKDMANIDLNKEYQYVYTVATNKLVIQRANELYRELDIGLRTDDEHKLLLFKNMSAIIAELLIVDDQNKETNVLLQKTFRKFVPSTISGPVIIESEDGNPLDLSASYREVLNGNKNYYLFTNYEREIFPDVREPIVLAKPVADVSGAVKLYGIPHDAVISEENFYLIPQKAMVNSIDLYTSKYDIIDEMKYIINYDRPEIEITAEVRALYQAFLVDYLKNDSYCINFLQEYGSYEVEASSNNDALYMSYESTDGSVSDYKITSIKPDRNKYIVLRKQQGGN
ncbi:hypothetical protein [Anaerospora hongkongensis]|uniref:hypothetical protein n=1 Tax=Anaerospora hongkongensis TaxID=244830 RepID=UPI00289AFBD8|nr:hypothetical protein [Anaerospora hongkongensis]